MSRERLPSYRHPAGRNPRSEFVSTFLARLWSEPAHPFVVSQRAPHVSGTYELPFDYHPLGPTLGLATATGWGRKIPLTDFCHLNRENVHPRVACSRPLAHGSRRGGALGGLGLERLGRAISGVHGPEKGFGTTHPASRSPLRGRDMGLLDPWRDGERPLIPLSPPRRLPWWETFVCQVAHSEAAKNRFQRGA